MDVRDVMDFNGVSKQTAINYLNKLIKKGLIKRSGRTNQTVYVFND